MTLAYLALSPGNFIVWLIIGGIAGWVTGRLMGGGYGFIGDIVLGLVGALIGGLVAGIFFTGAPGFIGTLIVAIIGSIIVVAAWRAISHSTGHSSAL
jgi:uncharacterized membrane protein YeaQ/YmgE (transglycosylase-associated protein family)